MATGRTRSGRAGDEGAVVQPSVWSSMVEDNFCRRTVTVNLKEGLHLRPISQIVETVRRFGCPVRISNGDLSADAGNVLDLIPLKIECGHTVILEASGESASAVMAALVQLFESNFEEPNAGGESSTPVQ